MEHLSQTPVLSDEALAAPPPNLAPPAPRPPPPPPPMMSRTISPAAVGSRTTVYLPGSRRFGLRHFMAFSIAVAASAAPSISRIRADGCPAQPELDPSGYRIVVLMCESAERW